jgi:hypothetical protein
MPSRRATRRENRMLQEACTPSMRGRDQRDGFERLDTFNREVDSLGGGLVRMHEELLAPLFWLALGCALGWQGKVCYAGEHPDTLLETVPACA